MINIIFYINIGAKQTVQEIHTEIHLFHVKFVAVIINCVRYGFRFNKICLKQKTKPK